MMRKAEENNMYEEIRKKKPNDTCTVPMRRWNAHWYINAKVVRCMATRFYTCFNLPHTPHISLYRMSRGHNSCLNPVSHIWNKKDSNLFRRCSWSLTFCSLGTVSSVLIFCFNFIIFGAKSVLLSPYKLLIVSAQFHHFPYGCLVWPKMSSNFWFMCLYQICFSFFSFSFLILDKHNSIPFWRSFSLRLQFNMVGCRRRNVGCKTA